MNIDSMKNNNKTTESLNINSKDIDTKSISDMISIFNNEDLKIINSINNSSVDIESIIREVVSSIQSGGKLIYVGAGTSGRIGVMDAAECMPTFGIDKDMVQGIIAGGDDAMFRSIEGAEDKVNEIKNIIERKKITASDMIIGISCSGGAKFVLEFLKLSKIIGASTALITFNNIDNIDYVDRILRVDVGPEIIAGSTRMKSGTATKIILNMISTITMIRLNKTYGNYMVDLKVMNEKLFNRAVNITSSITGLNQEKSKNLLSASNNYVKNAIVMHKLQIGFEESERVLENCKGSLRAALDKEV